MKEYKIGDVLRIRPKEGVSTWARHHIYILTEKGWEDTYWSNGNTPYTYEELAKMSDNRIIDNDQNINDMVQMPPARYEAELYQYDPKDTLYIPMGGWHERCLIRKGAEPLKEKVIEQIGYKVREKMGKIESLVDDVRELLRTLERMKYDEEEPEDAA